MYLDPPASEERVPSSYPFRVALGLSALGVLFVGIVPGPLLRLAEIAVGSLA
jgi:NADH:ubiquinone oxidoreductase subunit 2 (subunit N)